MFLDTRPRTDQRFLWDEAGATAIEYGLIAAMFAIVCIVGWQALGLALNGKFAFIAGTVNGAIN
jgi:pilus assembly protein Flp/PilA